MAIPKNTRPEDLDAIANRLRLLRATTGLSQHKFTEWVGLGYSQWANFEASKGRIGLDAALTLTRKMGVPLDWIYLGQEAWLPSQLRDRLRDAERARAADLKRSA